MEVAQIETIGQQWVALTRQCLSQGQMVLDGDVKLLELSSIAFCITRPSASDPLVDRFGKPAMVAAMRKNFIESEPQFGYKFGYGERIWKGGEASPYAGVLRRLKQKPETKSASFSLLRDGQDDHVPCIVAMDFKIRDEKVHLHYFARSQDVYKKSYADNLALLVVMERLAKDLGKGIGTISGYIASAHVYMTDVEEAMQLEQADDVLSSEPVQALKVGQESRTS